MLQRFRAMRTNESGFTLVELLIVIVILGILAGIVVFAIGGITDRGILSACKADRKTVETAVEAYRANTGGYPVAADSPARYAILTNGGAYLREAPSTTNYTIDLNAGGAVAVAVQPPGGGC